MRGNFHEAHEVGEIVPPAERSTGLVFAGAAVVFAVVFRAMPVVVAAALAAAVLMTALALIAPGRLRPLNRAWFRLGLGIGRIVNPIVLAVLFVTTIVPFGLAVRRWHDPLVRRRRPKATTYWIERVPTPASMRDQF